MDATTLAGLLRAVAAELERDPALASRIAEAMAAPTSVPSHAGRGESEGKGTRGAPLRTAGQEAGAAGVNHAFRPRLITGASAELGLGIPDPFALYAARGEDGLRAALDGLRLGGLRAIIREHRLDPSGRLASIKDIEKLRTAIVQAAARSAR